MTLKQTKSYRTERIGKHMYDILIVDDEYFARKNLIDFWKWEDHDCRIKADVSNAADAISYLNQHHVDIVFTDVSMPETSGIELAEYINKTHPDISVVVFSSYSDFDYVKGAFSHNVIDYILKYEISEDVLNNLIEKIKGCKHSGPQDSISGEIKKEKAYRKTVIDAIINNVPNSFTHAVILAANINSFKIYTTNDRKILSSNINNIIAQTVSDIKGFVVFCNNTYNVLYLPFPDNMSEASIMQTISEFVRKINISVYNLFSIRLSYGVSTLSTPAYSIHQCFNEAISMLLSLPSSCSDITSEHSDVNKLSISAERKLLTFLSELNLNEIQKCLESIFDVTKKDTNNRILINELLAIASDFCIEYNIPNSDLPIITDSVYTNTVCLNWSKKMFEYLITEYKQRQNYTDHDKYIQKTLEYIAEYYSDENLSLESIAKHIGISKYYLSRVFKNKLHKSISSYLNEYRIKRAKELLTEDFISLKNCHFLVGFKDYTYFSTQFKRYEGCSPANYIKKFKNEIK